MIVTAVAPLTTALPRVRAAGEGLPQEWDPITGVVRALTLGEATLPILTEAAITEITPTRSQNTSGLAAEAGLDPGQTMIRKTPPRTTSHSTMRI